MVSGRVDADLQIWVPIELVDICGTSHSTEAVLDTGFDGSLSLPRELINRLGWEPELPVVVMMANGERTAWDTWDGVVIWHTRVRDVLVFEVEQHPLLGMELVSGSQLTIQARNGGQVLIEEL